MYKLKTVDVWDTLLRRDCHPDCIKLSTALHLYIRFRNDLKKAYADHWAIYRARLEAEAELGAKAFEAGNDNEYSLEEVLESLLGKILVNPAGETATDDALSYELATEIARSYPDPEIVAFLKNTTAEKTIFLSDFYMKSKMVSQLLESKGLSQLISTGISSCDVGKNKRSGKLFSHVHTVYQITSKEHIHIGDNLYSDIESPRRLGISVERYIPQNEHNDRLLRERLFTSKDVLFDHLRRESLLSCNSKIGTMSAEEAAAFRFGLEAAPLFIGFCLYIAEQAVSSGIDKLYFFTREGEFFHKIFELLFSEGSFFGHQIPKQEVLEVSRLSTFAASMNTVSLTEFQRIWRLHRCQKVAGLFAILGLNPGDFTTLLEELRLSPEDLIEMPEGDFRLEKLFLSPVFQVAATESVRNKRALVCEYLNAKDFCRYDNIGIVDIGWRGTIQDNLAHIYPEKSIRGFYLGLRQPINPQPNNVSKSAYAIDERVDSDWAKPFEAFAVLEMISCSPNGSVEEYEKKDGVVIAKRHICALENESFFGFSSFFQEGVISACTTWKPYIERYVVTSGDLRELALLVWHKFGRYPPSDMVNVFLKAPQHDVFGFGDLYYRNNAPSLPTIMSAFFSSSSRGEVIRFIRRVQWTSAIRHLKGIGRFHKLVLTVLFLAAHSIKKSRIYKMRFVRLSTDR